MTQCTFCGREIRSGTGKKFVKTSGKVLSFCSNKCEKNMLKLKRKPIKKQWTATSRKERAAVKKRKEGKKK